MTTIDALVHGFTIATLPHNLAFCLLGCLLGTLIGVLPGIGPVATVAILMPITFTLEPATAIIMLAGIFYGSQYGGSTTAILARMPGEASSVVTCIDGHEMARQNRAGVALFTAAIGSFFAGCVGTLMIVVVAAPLNKVATSFGSPEYFALMILGLIAATTISSGSALKSIAMILLGLMLGTVGIDGDSGQSRYTFGHINLFDGISFVALGMGIYGISELIENNERKAVHAPVETLPVGRLLPSGKERWQIWPPIFRGTAVGSTLGVLPGAGTVLSSFAAYMLERRIALDPSRFGKGAIEGVAAPEAANNASAQVSFIPMLSLGIPPNATMALMLGALMIHGISPGPFVMTREPDLFWGLIVSMWIGNLMLLFINLPLIGVWVWFLKIPRRLLFPTILLLCALGAYGTSNDVFDVYVLALFGAAGYAMRKLDCDPAPLILGFILGPMMEEHLRRSMKMWHGDISNIVERPISFSLLVIAALLLILLTLPAIRRARDKSMAE